MARGKKIKINPNSKGIQELPKSMEKSHGSVAKLTNNMKKKPSERGRIFKSLDSVWPDL